MSEKEIVWDLSEVFASVEDPKITEIMNLLMVKTECLINQYNSKINTQNFTVDKLYDLLKQYELLVDELEKLINSN